VYGIVECEFAHGHGRLDDWTREREGEELLQLNLTTGIFENNELLSKITELLFSKMTA
jgi:hypothetical protein